MWVINGYETCLLVTFLTVSNHTIQSRLRTNFL